MLWQIASFPRCEHHVFLSHCAGDRGWLVHAVHEELKRREIIPWLDRDHYYYGRDSRTALRDGLLRSRHTVFFITLEMMNYSRGWCPMELAYSDLLQANLTLPGGPLLNLELPLFFLAQDHGGLPYTVWNTLRDRGEFHLPRDGNEIEWAVNRIVAFLHREQKLALEMSRMFLESEDMRLEISRRPGLFKRVTSFDPSPIP